MAYSWTKDTPDLFGTIRYWLYAGGSFLRTRDNTKNTAASPLIVAEALMNNVGKSLSRSTAPPILLRRILRGLRPLTKMSFGEVG